MARSTVLTLLLLCGCAAQESQVPIGPERRSSVIIETDRGSQEVQLTAAPPNVHSSVALAPVDQAWAALPGAYAALGLQRAHAVDGAERTYRAGPATVPRRLGGERPSRFLDCGTTVSMPNADGYEVTLEIVTRLRPEGAAATRVETVVHATARPRETSGNLVSCTSNGQLERRIARHLQTAR
jgi:hypothetical protein